MVITDSGPAKVQKPTRKATAPRFVSPVTGMIVDQGTDVVLEGIVDGEFTDLHVFVFVRGSKKDKKATTSIMKNLGRFRGFIHPTGARHDEYFVL